MGFDDPGDNPVIANSIIICIERIVPSATCQYGDTRTSTTLFFAIL